MRIALIILTILINTNSLIAQEIVFRKKNGVIINKSLTDEEWFQVKNTYVPDSIKYFTLTIVDYSTDEMLKMDDRAFRKALMTNGVDSTKAYTKKYIDTTNKMYNKLIEDVSSNAIERIKKEYKGEIRIKKNSEIDSTDRFILRTGFFNTAYSESSGWMSLNRFYFEDRKLKKAFPLIMREPKSFFEKI